MGQEQVFEQASQVLEALASSRVTAKQLERLCHYYGELAEARQEKQADALHPVDNRLHYAMVDGGHRSAA